MKTLLTAIWHLTRFTLATCVSTVATGLLPMLAAFTPILLAGAWVLVWALDFVVFLLAGESMLQGVLVDEPLGIVLVPVAFASLGLVSVVLVLLVVVAFNLLVVLPIGVAVEFVCRQLSVHRVLPRLGGFLLAGLMAGLILVGLAMVLVGVSYPDASSSLLLGSGLVLLLCICSVFASGLVLTLLTALKNRAIQWKARMDHHRTSAAILVRD